MPLKEAYAYATKVMVENMMARDAEEGIGAFLDKRKPEWKGARPGMQRSRNAAAEEPTMEPRLSLVTLGVGDVARARAFYEALGFKAGSASEESVTFLDAGGVVLALFGRASLAEDAGVATARPRAGLRRHLARPQRAQRGRRR